MQPAEWIALSVGAIGILINLATVLVGYGVLKGTVSALAARVAALEAELGALSELKLQVAKIETRLEGLIEQFKDLNASIRWMRDPATPESPARVSGQRRRRSGGGD
jgi:hypothetical protein